MKIQSIKQLVDDNKSVYYRSTSHKVIKCNGGYFLRNQTNNNCMNLSRVIENISKSAIEGLQHFFAEAA